MNVTAKNHDDVSALLTVTIDKGDYKEKVEKQLHHYAKNAQIPGFRKGKVPLSMVKRQYEGAIVYEEINKMINDSLNNYITEKNIRLVGQPVPVLENELNFEQDQHEVQFEIGYEPDFKINLEDYEAPHYQVEASEKEINQSIENMQKRFATQVPQDKIGKDSYVVLQISQIVEDDAEGEHNHAPKNTTITPENKAAFKLIKDLKMDDSVKITKSDLEGNEDLAKELGFSKSEVEHLHHDELEISVKDFYGLNNHELNQDLFDKVYGKDNIKSEEELKSKVKSELDDYFQQNADVHFVNKIIEQINSNKNVQLPEEFLVKWLIHSNQNINNEAQAQEILEKEKTALKAQIIEGKLLNDNEIKVGYPDLVSQAEQLVRNQLAMYGIHHLGDEEVQKYAVEMLKDENQTREIYSDVAMNKLKEIILEKSKKQATKISHEDFLETLKK